MLKFGKLNFVKTGLKSKFGVNPQSFSHELCLYITRFSSCSVHTDKQARAAALIGASLSEPHTSVTALRTCVCMLACLLACGHIP